MKNALLILVIVLIVTISIFVLTQKKNKGELAVYYRISRPTLSKWVKLIPCEIPFKEWQKRRKLTVWEISMIKHQWGNDSKMVLSKKQLVELTSSDYKTLARHVKDNLEKIGLTLEAWEGLNEFPPVISQRIIDLLIGTPEPTLEERYNALFA